MAQKKTHEQYVAEVAKINPNIEVVEEYISADTKILHKCKIDGYEWKVLPSSILRGRGCPKCANKLQHTTDEYIEMVSKINPNIHVLEEYVSNNIKILHKCTICGHVWSVLPKHILHGSGCPVCSHRAIGAPPEYQNSIFSSEYKQLFKKYLTEDQMKQYMPHSNQKILMTCPDCQRIKLRSPSQVLHDGFGCVCGDGKSYPNKFILSFLEQLKVEFVPEHKFEWSNGKLYDFYLPKFNCIIEAHGIQHYEYSGFGRSICDEQNNDKIKYQMAQNNGIQHYITLDCRKSTPEWIWKSIQTSQIQNIINKDLSVVNLSLCDQFATSNLVYIAAEHWNNGNGIKEISQLLNVDRNTIRMYLKKAQKNQWCDYNKKESWHRVIERKNKNNPGWIQVYCLEQNKIYKSIRGAAAELHLNSSNISACCRGKYSTVGGYHWYYVHDKQLKNRDVIKGAISLGLISEENISI